MRPLRLRIEGFLISWGRKRRSHKRRWLLLSLMKRSRFLKQSTNQGSTKRRKVRRSRMVYLRSYTVLATALVLQVMKKVEEKKKKQHEENVTGDVVIGYGGNQPNVIITSTMLA